MEHLVVGAVRAPEAFYRLHRQHAIGSCSSHGAAITAVDSPLIKQALGVCSSVPGRPEPSGWLAARPALRRQAAPEVLAIARSLVDRAMRVALVLVVLATGCSTMTLRTGVVIVGGRPAFQASAEVGVSYNAKRRSVQATHEYGVETGDGTRGIIAVNLDVMEVDPETGPITRIGPRFRAAFHDQTSTSAFELRGAFYTGILRDPRTGSGGLGVELAGGAQTDPTLEPIFEANLVTSGKWSIW
jgi:hypothetical protein